MGLIHSPLAERALAWPDADWIQSLPASAHYQTPYQWAISYALAAGLVYFWPRGEDKENVPTPGPETATLS